MGNTLTSNDTDSDYLGSLSYLTKDNKKLLIIGECHPDRSSDEHLSYGNEYYGNIIAKAIPEVKEKITCIVEDSDKDQLGWSEEIKKHFESAGRPLEEDELKNLDYLRSVPFTNPHKIHDYLVKLINKGEPKINFYIMRLINSPKIFIRHLEQLVTILERKNNNEDLDEIKDLSLECWLDLLDQTGDFYEKYYFYKECHPDGYSDDMLYAKFLGTLGPEYSSKPVDVRIKEAEKRAKDSINTILNDLLEKHGRTYKLLFESYFLQLRNLCKNSDIRINMLKNSISIIKGYIEVKNPLVYSNEIVGKIRQYIIRDRSRDEYNYFLNTSNPGIFWYWSYDLMASMQLEYLIQTTDTKKYFYFAGSDHVYGSLQFLKNNGWTLRICRGIQNIESVNKIKSEDPSVGYINYYNNQQNDYITAENIKEIMDVFGDIKESDSVLGGSECSDVTLCFLLLSIELVFYVIVIIILIYCFYKITNIIMSSNMATQIPPKPTTIKPGYTWVYIINNWHSVPDSIEATHNFDIVIGYISEQGDRQRRRQESLMRGDDYDEDDYW
jgi:hypothetical protein